MRSVEMHEAVKIAMTGNHVDHALGSDDFFCHGREHCPLVHIHSIPVGPTGLCGIDDLSRLVVAESEVGIKQSSGLQLFEETGPVELLSPAQKHDGY